LRALLSALRRLVRLAWRARLACPASLRCRKTEGSKHYYPNR
jgi:hypothetical protein